MAAGFIAIASSVLKQWVSQEMLFRGDRRWPLSAAKEVGCRDVENVARFPHLYNHGVT
jgi:hypothetical protein